MRALKQLFKADRVYEGGQFRQNWAILIEDGTIIETGEQTVLERKYTQTPTVD